MDAVQALDHLISRHGHCLLMEDHGLARGLVTLHDLQKGLGLSETNRSTVRLGDCCRCELVGFR